MNTIFKRNRGLVIKAIIIITILIPLGITAYEIVVLGKDSVVFLGDYPPAVSVIVVIYYAILLIAGIVWLIVQLKAVLKLKNEKTKNELLHLQSQVNPHFFFNMLNNLYGLVDKDVEQSKTIILKLSDLMRYSIYEGQQDVVTIGEEVAYLKNYIDLHSMRYHKDIDIKFRADIEDDTQEVTPLLFIILLENAFKHGVENLREKAYVYINIEADKKRIVFDIENNFDPNELPEKPGIGIKNLKRRLELAYRKRHKLTISGNNAVYRAQLQLYND